MINREAFNGGERYCCTDCGVTMEENFYPTNHVGYSAKKLWEENRTQAIAEGISFSGRKDCDCKSED